MLKHIDRKEVKFIVELGGHDFTDTLLLFDAYQCPIVTFEPNPNLNRSFRHKIDGNRSIKLVEMGVWDKTGTLDFHICTSEVGASSFYKFDYTSLGQYNHETAQQTETRYPMHTIKAPIITLDDWLSANGMEQIDLLCMDVQGGALNVLRGLSNHLHRVKYIITEVEYHRIYDGEFLFYDIESFMKEHGFSCFNKETDPLFNDVIFVRNDLILKN
jgi:FkbM family methyltransferase